MAFVPLDDSTNIFLTPLHIKLWTDEKYNNNNEQGRYRCIAVSYFRIFQEWLMPTLGRYFYWSINLIFIGNCRVSNYIQMFDKLLQYTKAWSSTCQWRYIFCIRMDLEKSKCSAWRTWWTLPQCKIGIRNTVIHQSWLTIVWTLHRDTIPETKYTQTQQKHFKPYWTHAECQRHYTIWLLKVNFIFLKISTWYNHSENKKNIYCPV